ncbi:MAG TPA: GAF domain-containing protein, partial [bacterium]|nr:GAF domain-containing protein [bacterium]
LVAIAESICCKQYDLDAVFEEYVRRASSFSLGSTASLWISETDDRIRCICDISNGGEKRSSKKSSVGTPIDLSAAAGVRSDIAFSDNSHAREMNALRQAGVLLPQTRSCLLVPLKSKGTRTGFALHERFEAPEQWNENGLHFVRSASGFLAYAIEEKRIHESLEELRRTDKDYRAAIENTSGVPYRLLLPERRYAFIGSGLERLIGISRDEFTLDRLKQSIREVVLMDAEGPHDPDQYKKAFADGKLTQYRADLLVETADGGLKWLSDCSVPVYDSSGTVVGSLGILQDITSRKLAERDLLRKNARLRTLNEIAKLTSGRMLPEELAEKIFNAVHHTIACDAFFLNQYRERDDALRRLKYYDTIDGVIQEVQPRDPAFELKPYTKSCANELREVLLERRPVMILRSPDELVESGLVVYGSDRRSASLLFVPLVAGDQCVGLMSVQSYQYSVYSQEDLDFLVAVAQQTGPAFEAAILSKEILDREQAQRCFSEKLTALIQVTSELASAESLDDLCRGAVELGRSRLGFDRVSLWLLTEEPHTVEGTFGTDEFGKTRDERDVRLRLDPNLPSCRVLSGDDSLILKEDWELYNHLHQVVGKGCYAVAAVWDGDRVIGFLSTDNLLTRQNISEYQTEILRLYGSVLGTLYSRKRAEQQLRHSEQIYRTAIEWASGVPYQFRVGDGQFDFIGSGLESLLGISAEEFTPERFEAMIVEQTVTDPRGPSDPSEYRESFLDGVLTHYRMDVKVRLADGQEKWLSDTQVPYFDTLGRVEGSLGILQDISDRKKAEEDKHRLETRILHAQKLESLGILAGGIAHDFNNLLMGMLGHADLALSQMPRESPARENVTQIETAALRAADLTRQMLAYSGKGQFLIQPLNLSKLIEEMVHLLEVSISKRVTLRFSFAQNLPSVLGDPGQLRQVFMNLILNASDAIGDHDGVISVTTGIVKADRDYLAQTYFDENLPEGEYVYAEVSDTGCGMDRETIRRIFDPFFTTKFTGRGLGLAAVLGIVRGLKGAIRVYSHPGAGSTFKVLLPSCDARVLAADQEETQLEMWRSDGVILVVDDEESVLTVAQRALELRGFSVLTAKDGLKGVDLFRRHAEEIRLVLLDMTMPLMDGEEAFFEMKKIKADVPVILSSGYTEQEATNRFHSNELSGFIQKPYRPIDLIKKIKALLDQKP